MADLMLLCGVNVAASRLNAVQFAKVAITLRRDEARPEKLLLG